MATDRCDLLCLDLPRAEALRRDRLDAGEATRRAAVIAALGDPTRLVIALALRDGDELCVCDLAWIVERSQKLVSHHLRLLRAQSLVRSRRDGKMVMYALTEAGLEALGSVDRLARVGGAVG
jgi:DNA-binding transcriptional ArsR family regulator